MRMTITMQQIFLWGTGWSLPALLRREWLAQWSSELWYVHSEGATPTDTWRFTLGSLQDANNTRRDSPEEALLLTYSPRACLLTMALLNVGLAALGLLFSPSRSILATALHGLTLREALCGSTDTSSPLHQQMVLVALTFVFSSLVTAITSGAQVHPRRDRSGSTWRSRREGLLFSVAKLSLGIPLVYFAALALSSTFVRTEETPLLQIARSLAGYIGLLRWIHFDQERRCPICLKRLSSPVQLGRLSWALLDWNLREYVCSEGHGVMQVPVAPLMGQSVQNWLPLV